MAALTCGPAIFAGGDGTACRTVLREAELSEDRFAVFFERLLARGVRVGMDQR